MSCWVEEFDQLVRTGAYRREGKVGWCRGEQGRAGDHRVMEGIGLPLLLLPHTPTE